MRGWRYLAAEATRLEPLLYKVRKLDNKWKKKRSTERIWIQGEIIAMKLKSAKTGNRGGAFSLYQLDRLLGSSDQALTL